VNPNKRVESVIKAIGDSERLRARTLYEIVGRIEPEVADELGALARTLGVDLSIAGEVDDATLREAVRGADAVCCLRYPALESASASAIEAMLYGKAVVVLDTGFFRDLPDDCVRKVSPKREIVELSSALEALEADPAARIAQGERAAEWASRTFRADNYAQSLVHMGNAASAASPILAAGRYYVDTLLRWGATEQTLSAPEIVAPLRIFERRSGPQSLS
jgi:glycosyltransferase involved in cell wall biosynthesis